MDRFTKMTGKSVKDVDRFQAVLNSLLALEENKYCADCESKGRRSSGWPVHDSTVLHVFFFFPGWKMLHCIHPDAWTPVHHLPASGTSPAEGPGQLEHLDPVRKLGN